MQKGIRTYLNTKHTFFRKGTECSGILDNNQIFQEEFYLLHTAEEGKVVGMEEAKVTFIVQEEERDVCFSDSVAAWLKIE